MPAGTKSAPVGSNRDEQGEPPGDGSGGTTFPLWSCFHRGGLPAGSRAPVEAPTTRRRWLEQMIPSSFRFRVAGRTRERPDQSGNTRRPRSYIFAMAIQSAEKQGPDSRFARLGSKLQHWLNVLAIHLGLFPGPGRRPCQSMSGLRRVRKRMASPGNRRLGGGGIRPCHPRSQSGCATRLHHAPIGSIFPDWVRRAQGHDRFGLPRSALRPCLRPSTVVTGTALGGTEDTTSPQRVPAFRSDSIISVEGSLVPLTACQDRSPPPV